MQLETNAAPGAAAELPAPVVVDETTVAPEATNPQDESQQPETTPEPERDQSDKALKALQRRIDKRTAALYQERAQREQLARELAELKGQYQQPEQQQQPDPVQLAREIARIERVTERSNQIAASGEKAFPDFREAVITLAQEVGPLYEPNGKPTPLMDAVLDSDAPHALLYHLGKNPELAADLADLSPTQQARRLARIEMEMGSKPAPPARSKAPAPLSPVRPSPGPKAEGEMSDAEWMQARLKQRIAALRGQ